MPMFDNDAAGNSPRNASSDFALVACRYTKSLSPGCCGKRSATQACIAGRSAP